MARVVDASVAIKWFIEEEGREKALTVFEEILHTPGQFAVPELFYFELAHVFHRVVPLPTPKQIELLSLVSTLGMYRFSMTPELLAGIRAFQKLGLSGYDSAYLALAKIIKGKWLTFDKKTHDRVSRLHLSELLL